MAQYCPKVSLAAASGRTKGSCACRRLMTIPCSSQFFALLVTRGGEYQYVHVAAQPYQTCPFPALGGYGDNCYRMARHRAREARRCPVTCCTSHISGTAYGRTWTWVPGPFLPHTRGHYIADIAALPRRCAAPCPQCARCQHRQAPSRGRSYAHDPPSRGNPRVAAWSVAQAARTVRGGRSGPSQRIPGLHYRRTLIRVHRAGCS